MIDKLERIGNFTSSQIFRLASINKDGTKSKSFYTYVEEKMYERKLKRSVQLSVYSKSMAWGKLLEKRVNDMLGLEYEMINKQTFINKKYPFHTGSPDFKKGENCIAELKCFEPKNAASYISACLSNDTEIIKEKHAKEYWQMVSNSIILNTEFAEAIIYIPYESEMQEISELCQDPLYLDKVGLQPWEVRYITEMVEQDKLYNLPCIPDDSSFKNLNVFNFEVPIKDKIFLTKCILDAEKLINNG